MAKGKGRTAALFPSRLAGGLQHMRRQPCGIYPWRLALAAASKESAFFYAKVVID